MISVEATKLSQTGFEDFLADLRVSRLKGKCDANKEVFYLIQFVTAPVTNKLIVNSKV